MEIKLWYLPAFLFFIPLIAPHNSELVLFPTDKKYEITPYIDTADSEGNSLCTLTKVTDSSIVFDFTLHKLHGDPYAGFTINLFRANSYISIHGEPYAGFIINQFGIGGFIDISSYDSMCVDITTRQASFFEVQLLTFIENVTEMNDLGTCHTMTCRVPVDLILKRYSLPMGDFQLAPWWDKWAIRKFGILAKGLPRKPEYSKLFGINFQGGAENVENTPVRFIITKIAFVKKSKKGAVAIICGACFAAYAVIVFLVGFMVGKMKTKKDKEIRRVIEYINAHYRESPLTAEQVGQGIGMSPECVVKGLRKRFGITLSEYVNDIKRVFEFIHARFQEPGLTVEQIAQQAGISPERVVEILRYRSNMTFEQYRSAITQVVEFIKTHYKESGLTEEQIAYETRISSERVSEIVLMTFRKTLKQYIEDLKKDESKKISSGDDTFDPHPVPPNMIDLEYKHLETYIRNNYTNSDLTLEDIARGADISHPRVTIILQQIKNMTFPQYLNDVRINAAKKLLVSTNLPINDIGYNVGYNNIPHFNRVFSKMTDCSPGEYREKNKASNKDVQS